jgi:phosphatidylserine/phosphatidylglycerophosphate/cardiolipin synthase-like enzyme
MNPLLLVALAAGLYYAPEERLDAIDVTLIENAETEISFAAFVLTDTLVIEALNDAAERGVHVRIILDNRQQSDLSHLVNIEIRKKRPGPLMHLKAFEVDHEVLRTGSANFSQSGETQQDNNLLVIHDPAAISKFSAHFERMWSTANASYH